MLTRLEEELMIPVELRSLLWAMRARWFSDLGDRQRAIECRGNGCWLWIRMVSTRHTCRCRKRRWREKPIAPEPSTSRPWNGPQCSIRKPLRPGSLRLLNTLLAASQVAEGATILEVLKAVDQKAGGKAPAWEQELLALAMLDSVDTGIAALVGSFDPRDVRQLKELLREKESVLESLGRAADAAEVREEIFAPPPRDPSLPE